MAAVNEKIKNSFQNLRPGAVTHKEDPCQLDPSCGHQTEQIDEESNVEDNNKGYSSRNSWDQVACPLRSNPRKGKKSVRHVVSLGKYI